MKDLALRIAAFVFLTVALIHAARLLLGLKVTVGKFVVPLWLSIVGILVALSLAWLMLRAV